MNGYSFEKYIDFYWEGNTVYNESVLPLRTKDGSLVPLSLLYPADSIISVCNAELTWEYSPGRDYILENGKLVIPEGSRIYVSDYSELYLDEPIEGHSFEGTNGGYLYYSEGDYFHTKQIAVTYRHSGTWEGTVPAAQGKQLPRTLQKLKNGEKISIAFFGDSICEGNNCTGFVGVHPYMPVWTDLIIEYLRKTYPQASVKGYNGSVPGTGSQFGAEHIESLICPHRPDLMVLAFGINDAPGKLEASVHQDFLRQMMNSVRKVSPNCEFILIASMRSNAEAKLFQGEALPSYRLAAQELTGEGVVMADMLTMHEDLLRKKNFRDMTGNHINHVNDFLGRAYAQLIIKTLSE